MRIMAMDGFDYKLDIQKLDPVLLRYHAKEKPNGRYVPVYGSPGRPHKLQRSNANKNYYTNIYGRRKSSLQVVLVSGFININVVNYVL